MYLTKIILPVSDSGAKKSKPKTNDGRMMNYVWTLIEADKL
jgi:hypothetical protein